VPCKKSTFSSNSATTESISNTAKTLPKFFLKSCFEYAEKMLLFFFSKKNMKTVDISGNLEVCCDEARRIYCGT